MRLYAPLLIFLLFLSLPSFQLLTKIFPQMPLNENRKMTQLPNFGELNTNYLHDLAAWYDDNFGFRDMLIRLKTQFDVSIFGVSDKIHIGSDGWLFYRSVMDVQKPGVEVYLRESNRVESITKGVKKLSKILKSRGVTLVLSVMPMKDVIYGDHLPRTAQRLPEPHQIDILQQNFKAIDEIVYIDTLSILREAAKHRTVFHRTDFHWNDPAAFEVAQSLVNRLGRLDGKREATWSHQLQMYSKKLSGGEANFLPLFVPPQELALFVERNWVDDSTTQMQAPFEYISKRNNPTQYELPPIMVVGDSFFDGMARSGFNKYFEKVYRGHWNNLYGKSILDNIPEDVRYLFIEFIEVQNNALVTLHDFNELLDH
jgi:hypothetical protein